MRREDLFASGVRKDPPPCSEPWRLVVLDINCIDSRPFLSPRLGEGVSGVALGLASRPEKRRQFRGALIKAALDKAVDHYPVGFHLELAPPFEIRAMLELTKATSQEPDCMLA